MTMVNDAVHLDLVKYSATPRAQRWNCCIHACLINVTWWCLHFFKAFPISSLHRTKSFLPVVYILQNKPLTCVSVEGIQTPSIKVRGSIAMASTQNVSSESVVSETQIKPITRVLCYIYMYNSLRSVQNVPYQTQRRIILRWKNGISKLKKVVFSSTLLRWI